MSLGMLDSTGEPSTICVKLMLCSSGCVTDTLRRTLYSLVTTTQMKSPGIYSFHELRRFSAMMSAGMMNGARDLSVLIHMKSKSPAIGKDTGSSLPVDIGCPLLSRHEPGRK